MSEKIKAIIVDDESLARRGLALRLETIEDIEVIASCENGRMALEKIAELSPDLVFLDIQMPRLNGFEVVQQMQGDDMPMVVFVTAFDQYAVDAFEVHAIDYLLKPIENDRLIQAIQRVKIQLSQNTQFNQKQQLMDLISNITGKAPAEIDEMVAAQDSSIKPYPTKIAIKDSGKTELINVSDISWIEAAGDYMCIHSKNPKKVSVLRSTMKDIEERLNPSVFQRIHRSSIINLDCIQKVCTHINGEFFLILEDETRIKMSRSYRSKIKHII